MALATVGQARPEHHGAGRIPRNLNSIHGPDAWDANPWVAAISFTVHRCNIDTMEEDVVMADPLTLEIGGRCVTNADDCELSCALDDALGNMDQDDAQTPPARAAYRLSSGSKTLRPLLLAMATPSRGGTGDR